MNWHRISALIRKDLREVTANKMVLLPMIVVPIVLCAFVPGILLVVALSLDVALISGVEFFEKILPLYSIPEGLDEVADKVIFVFLNYTFVPFFMLIPIMVASVISANSIVGEKERKTLETLLYTPITNREFLLGKLLSSFLPAVAVTFISFLAYFLTTNAIHYAWRQMLIVRSLIWIPAIVLLSPMVSMLGLAITLLVSLRAKTYMEAQQTAGVIVLPFLALIVVQVMGLITFNVLAIVIFSLLLLGLNYLILSRIGPRFSRESIISTL